MDVTEGWGKYRFLKAIAKQLKNCPFGVNTTTELKTIKTTNNKQTNKIKVSTLKAIPKYYNEILVVSTFCFAHFSNIFFSYATIALRERCDVDIHNFCFL